MNLWDHFAFALHGIKRKLCSHGDQRTTAQLYIEQIKCTNKVNYSNKNSHYYETANKYLPHVTPRCCCLLKTTIFNALFFMISPPTNCLQNDFLDSLRIGLVAPLVLCQPCTSCTLGTECTSKVPGNGHDSFSFPYLSTSQKELILN